MSLESWIGIIVGISTIITSVGMGVKWLVKHYFDEIKKELKPNSGSSLKDQVNRLESEMKEADVRRKEMSDKIDHMYDLLLEFFANQANPTKTKK